MSGGHPAWFLVGPTATGKTAVAHHLAHEMGFELLSADAYQLYRELAIGTAKPDAAERRGLRYHGLDWASVSERFSVGQFLRRARQAFDDCAGRGHRMLVVGGTGLYIRALLDGLDAEAAADPEIRRRWRGLLDAGGPEALRAAVAQRSPGLLGRMPDPRNPRRLLRVLERLEQGLDPLPETPRARDATPPLPLLSCEPAALARRIEQRAGRMFADGLVDEVRRADAAADGRWSETARAAIGTAEALAVIEGRLSTTQAIEQVAARTRQLAKRQRTWYRHQVPTRDIEAPEDPRDVSRAARDVVEHWRLHGHHTVLAATAGRHPPPA